MYKSHLGFILWISFICLLYTFYYGKYQTYTKDEHSSTMNPYFSFSIVNSYHGWSCFIYYFYPLPPTPDFLRQIPDRNSFIQISFQLVRRLWVIFKLINKSVFICCLQSSFMRGSHLIISNPWHGLPYPISLLSLPFCTPLHPAVYD